MDANVDRNLGEMLIEQAPDAIIFAGKDGLIETWNAAATAMFGFTAEQALGQNLDIIVPESFRAAHWKGFDHALESRETKYKGKALPTKAMKANGDTFYVELSFSLVCDADGTMLGALANARDINERFEQDRNSRRKLRDLEKELEQLKATSAS